MSGIIINPYAFAATGLDPAAFVTEWTVSSGDTIILPSYDTNPLGTLDYDVDWGDGNSDSNVTTKDKTHTYTFDGGGTKVFQVVITNQFHSLNMQRASTTERGYLTNMVQWGTDTTWSTLRYMFYYCVNMQYTATDFPDISNMAESGSIRNMFQECQSVVDLDLSNWTNTDNITGLYATFWGMDSLETLNLTNWDISNSTSGGSMCYQSGSSVNGCDFIMPDLDWSNTANISSTFFGCYIKSIDVSGWTFGKNIAINSLFRQAREGSSGPSFSVNISTWNNTGYITTLNDFFRDSDVTSINATGIDTSNVTSTARFAYNCDNLTHITGLDEFDATSVTDANSMFQGADIFDFGATKSNFGSNWGTNLGSCTNLSNFFYHAGSTTPSSTIANVADWDTSAVTTFVNFMNGYKWTGGGNPDVSGFDVSNVTTFSNAFRSSSVSLLDTSSWSITSNCINMGSFLQSAEYSGDLDFGNCDFSAVTTFSHFGYAQEITGFALDPAVSFAAVTTMTNFITGNPSLTTTDYDALLLRLAATATNTGVTLTVTKSNYTLGGAVETARDTTLRTGRSWTINDDGGV